MSEKKGYLINVGADIKLPAKFQAEVGEKVLAKGQYLTLNANFLRWISTFPRTVFKVLNDLPDYLDNLKDDDNKPTILESVKSFFASFKEEEEVLATAVSTDKTTELTHKISGEGKERVVKLVEEVIPTPEETVAEIVESVAQYITEDAFHQELEVLTSKFSKHCEDLQKQTTQEIKKIQKIVDNINGGFKDISTKIDDLNKQMIVEKGRVTKLSTKVDELCREEEKEAIEEVVKATISPDEEIDDIELPINKDVLDSLKAITDPTEPPKPEEE